MTEFLNDVYVKNGHKNHFQSLNPRYKHLQNYNNSAVKKLL